MPAYSRPVAGIPGLGKGRGASPGGKEGTAPLGPPGLGSETRQGQGANGRR